MSELIPAAPEGFRSGFVALVGRPNVGKSTLLNRILGERVAITSPVAQTTRHAIQGIVTRPASQLIFVDTPGIHKPRHHLGERLVQTAQTTLSQADVVVFVGDASQAVGAGDRRIATTLLPPGVPVVMALNKVDLDPGYRRQVADYQALWPEPVPCYGVSAHDNLGITEFLDGLEALLPEGPYYYSPEQFTDQTERTICAELIREQVLHYTNEEIPHAVAVIIEQMEELPKITRIRAVIQVERDSQKGIIIGKGGQMLKAIGTEARLGMEQLLQTKVHLEIFVKVAAHWRRDLRQIKELYP